MQDFMDGAQSSFECCNFAAGVAPRRYCTMGFNSLPMPRYSTRQEMLRSSAALAKRGEVAKVSERGAIFNLQARMGRENFESSQREWYLEPASQLPGLSWIYYAKYSPRSRLAKLTTGLNRRGTESWGHRKMTR
jgi:hypothetical protein